MRFHPRRLIRRQAVCWLVLLVLGACLSTPQAQAIAVSPDTGALIEPLGSFGGQIADVAVQNNLAYIVQGAQFVVLDISTPAQITRLGVVALPDLHPASHVRVSGTLAFVLSSIGELIIIDVSNPTAPRLRGTYSERSIHPQRRPQDLVVHDHLVYLAMEIGGLRILDVSNPDVPVVLNPDLAKLDVRALDVVGTRAYLLTSSALHIYNVADPTQTEVLSTTPFAKAVDVEVDGTYAYISSAQPGYGGRFPIPGKVWLDVVDVNDGRSLTPINHLEIQTEGSASLQVADGWAYLGVDSGSLLLDIRNPANLVQRAQFPKSFRKAAIVGNRAYLAGSLTLQIVDLHHPDPPVEVGSYSSLDNFSCVRVVGDFAYIVEGGQQLLIFDVANPAQPQLLRREDDYRASHMCDMKVDGNRGFTDHFFFDLSDPIKPKVFNINLGLGGVDDLAITGNRLYAVRPEGLAIFDVSVPATPQLLSTLPITEGSPRRVAVAGQKVYVGGWSRLTVVDASDPASPRVLGISAPTLEPDMMVAVGDYVIYGGTNFQVFYVGNPSRPRVVRYGGFHNSTARYADGLLYESVSSSLIISDVREPSQHRFLPSWNFTYWLNDFDVHDNVIFVVGGGAGLRTYQLRSDRLPSVLSPLPPPTDLYLPFVAQG